jgi:bifunctional NMN adenylyltransferase/nudix hydrolase
LKYSAFILRGQPFHNAHKQIIQNALQCSDKVIVLIGSYRSSITIRNPWNYEVRSDFIRGSFSIEDMSRIIICPIRDYLYSKHTWITSVQNIISSQIKDNDEVTLYGHFKDDSSYYLNMFPQWKLEAQPKFKLGYISIDATLIRNMMFEENVEWKKFVPEHVAFVLEQYTNSEQFRIMKKEYQYILKYKKSWEKAPYPPTFVTTDAVVVQSGHVLLVKRKTEPGKGYFALPGGFLNQNETIEQCTIRELKEETKIDIPSVVLGNCIKDSHVFDHPLRSLRGRTITHASLIELDPMKSLPKVKGSDDAEKAFWMPFNELALHEEMFFEDHIHIIGYFLNGKLYNR